MFGRGCEDSWEEPERFDPEGSGLTVPSVSRGKAEAPKLLGAVPQGGTEAVPNGEGGNGDNAPKQVLAVERKQRRRRREGQPLDTRSCLLEACRRHQIPSPDCGYRAAHGEKGPCQLDR